MFAVPGWAVSADSLKARNPDFDPSASSATDIVVVNSRPKPKKRRRDEPGLSEPRVTSEALHNLWKREFGDGPHVKQRPPRVRKQKKKQIQKGSDPSHEEHTLLEVVGEDCNHANDKDNSESKDVSKNIREPKAKGKRRKKTKETVGSEKSVDQIPEKLGTTERVISAKDFQPGNAQDQSELRLQNEKAQLALRKLAELPLPASSKLTPLQVKMRDKLASARFRHLNETLYTSPSSTSLDLFTASPDLFAEYHAGFAQQVKDSWPENPVDGYIGDVKARAKANVDMSKQDSAPEILPLPRRKTGSCTIADLGCGDAPLARAFQTHSGALKLKFHSFDLHTPNSFVTKADIANVPLRDGEADVAVFCLSLMGTNWLSFIEESWRVLRGDGKGELWVAEVKSRFGRVSRGAAVEHSVGKKRKAQKLQQPQQRNESIAEDEMDIFIEDEGTAAQDETDVSAFVNVVQRRGFALQPQSVNKHNRMFVSMIFTKSGIPAAGKHKGLKWNGHEYEKSAGLTGGRKKFLDDEEDNDEHFSPEEEAKVLKPCVYKKR